MHTSLDIEFRFIFCVGIEWVTSVEPNLFLHWAQAESAPVWVGDNFLSVGDNFLSEAASSACFLVGGLGF